MANQPNQSNQGRKPIFQTYYTDEDFAEVIIQLPGIIKEAERKAGEVLEPTINEKREIMGVIRDFIREKHRKVYGGTALNEAIKAVNPDDAFYDDTTFSDIEFYSTTPKQDLVELCNLLYDKGYKYVVGGEAQHEETFTIFVNFQIYCDITFALPKIYNGIKTLLIDGINYTDPHFMLIDYLRMINQPLTAASQRWEKAFKRMYLLLKNYPFEYFDKTIKLAPPAKDVQPYIKQAREFVNGHLNNSCLVMGFDAYNFYIKHAANDKSVEQARSTYNSNKLDKMVVNVPYTEVISVDYKDNVEKIYNYLRGIVSDPKKLSIDEYFPLFQFTNYSAVIKYDGKPLIKIYEGDGFCIPDVKTTNGYMYVSYQYILMYMLINKFNAHLNKDKEMYFNYSIAISNLVDARNVYLTKKNLGVINKTVFGEFRVNCVGSTVSYSREGRLRDLKKNKIGKKKFKYTPEQFFAQPEEKRAKFDPGAGGFKNTSGNKIMIQKNLLFKLDSDGNIIKSHGSEEENDVGTSEMERVKSNVDVDTDILSIATTDINTENLPEILEKL